MLLLLCFWGRGPGADRDCMRCPILFAAASSHDTRASEAGADFNLVPKTRATFRHLHQVEASSFPERKGAILANIMEVFTNPCIPLISSLSATWRACLDKLGGISAFCYEQLDVMVGDRDPRDFDSLKLHNDRPAPVEPPWEEFIQASAPAPDDLVVPSWRFETIKDAVEGCKVRLVGTQFTCFTGTYV